MNEGYGTEQSLPSFASTGSAAIEGKYYGGCRMKKVNFVGKNPVPSKYIIIDDNVENQEKVLEDLIIDSTSSKEEGDQEHTFLPTKPWVLISVTGGAQDFVMHSTKLEQVFNRGLLKAAQHVSAWIVDGGSDAGVMQHVGKAVKNMAIKDVPYIGIATHKMIFKNDILTAGGLDNKAVNYVADKPNTPDLCALNPNHTHFILVNTATPTWGQEIRFRSKFEQYIRDVFDIPIVLIAVNGGPGTLETVAEAVEKNFATVVVQGSGRVSDAVAAMVKRAQKADESGKLRKIRLAAEIKITVKKMRSPSTVNEANVNEAPKITRALMAIEGDGVDISAWSDFLKEAKDIAKRNQWMNYMDRILVNYQEVTLFNADDEASTDMDIFILRAILTSTGNKFTLQEKLTWGVVWNRDDVIAEILENEKGRGVTDVQKQKAINAAFELAIQLDRPTIFSVLVENGAQVESVNLQKLYLYTSVRRNFTRLPAHAKTRQLDEQEQNRPVSAYPPKYSNIKHSKLLLKEVFKQAGSTFEQYHETFESKFHVNGDVTEDTNSSRPPNVSPNTQKVRMAKIPLQNVTSPSRKVDFKRNYSPKGKQRASKESEQEITSEIQSVVVCQDDENVREESTLRKPVQTKENQNSGPISNTPNKNTVSFNDILIWAVFVNRIDLAKVIWRNTVLPVHSALLACQLYRYLSHHCPNKDEYIGNANWFEDEAIKLMNIFEHTDIEHVLEWKWKEMGNRDVLDIAQDAKCKRFIGHPHIQNWLDANFYSDKYGKVEPTIATFQIWMSIVMPLFIYTIYKPTCGSQNENEPKRERAQKNDPNNGMAEKSSKSSIVYFYRLPIVKFWTSTFFYCGFLFVQAWVLCNLDQRDKFQAPEILLWVWVLSLAVEEVSQYTRNSMNHFKYLSNWMDVGILLLHVTYIALRLASYWMDQSHQHAVATYLAAINTLIIATLFSWGRLLNAFAINDSLGPLYFIIIRLFKDIFLWVFVFVIFAVSFQLGFVSITKQAGEDPLQTYPDGTFPVSYFTIIGEFSYAAPLLQRTPLGIALLAIYALLAQVILVNLLIAMMGATYSNVSENSAEEWKFYRLELMLENQSASFHPPPTNLIIVPIEFIYHHWKCKKHFSAEWEDNPEKEPLNPQPGPSNYKENSNKTENDVSESSKTKMKKKMVHTRNEVIEAENKAEQTSVANIVTNLQERMRTLSNERENDRTFLNKRLTEVETALLKTAREVTETTACLTQQNKRILALVEHITHQFAAIQQERNPGGSKGNERVLTSSSSSEKRVGGVGEGEASSSSSSLNDENMN
eukprot:Phypoly_transcript_00759.p1 GENE.Phypoly_transcript_00759~~Phypoly_transcript_00759.p1  ORF type:complete len:1303 (-),score=216.41 Phypoly_transcript_00759:155-4063(-)